MALAPSSPSIPVYRERVVSIQRAIGVPLPACLPNQTKLLLSRILATYVAFGDEITFPIPAPDAVGPRNPHHQERRSRDRTAISTRRQSDTSASPSRTNEISTSFLPRFTVEALASIRFSCLVRSCASTSIACLARPTESIIPPCMRSCVSRPALRPPSFAWRSSCVIWS